MFLYRGFATETSPDRMIRKKPRKLRKPKDTSPEIQKVVDKIFMEKFGWKPRAQGVFATSDFYNAEMYSRGQLVHIIFPFDGFEYLWSPKIEDLYTDVLEKGYSYVGMKYELEFGPDSGNGVWKKGKKTVKKLESLPNYWDEYDDNEYNYDLERYEYANVVSFSDDDGETYWEERWVWVPVVTLEEFCNEMLSKEISKEYKDTNLAAAIKSGNEVMILCKYYYAVPVEYRVRPKRFIGLYD